MSRWYGFDPSWDVKMVWIWSLVRCQHGMVLIPREMSRWYGLIPREMSRWYGLILREMSGFYGLIPREMSRWYGLHSSWDVEMVWFWHSWDVEMVWSFYSWDVVMVWFLILVRCKDGMVLILVRSGIVWFCPSWDVMMVWFWAFSWDVSLVWFFPREKSNPPDSSRGSTTSHESYQTSHEGENPSWEVKYLELVLVG